MRRFVTVCLVATVVCVGALWWLSNGPLGAALGPLWTLARVVFDALSVAASAVLLWLGERVYGALTG